MVITGYSYFGGSTVRDGGSSDEIALATCGGPEPHPFFFSGFLARPGVSAAMLLTVAKVAASRFYTPASMRDALIRAADPVVTADGERLRFESFSACNGVYARADLLGEAFVEGGFVAMGSTNVDFGASMRDALARIGEHDAAHLSVGADEVSVATLRSSVVEKKVRLPQRWLRGFAEVQVVQVSMAPRFGLDAAQTKRFLSQVARARRHGQWWATATADGLTLSATSSPGAVRIAGLERLGLLAWHARHAIGLRVWSTPNADASVASAWSVELPGGRLTLVLSPEPNRGFSGEGAVLVDVVNDTALDAAERLRECVRGLRCIDVDALSGVTGIAAGDVARGLNVLASAGVVGYDLATASFFHRELPFSADALALLHPRLRHAQALGADAVTVLSAEGDDLVVAVAGVADIYIVRQSGGRTSCTCRWYAEHGDQRGPCKHVLATAMVVNDTPDSR